ncbi:hypothetical protein BMR05_16675, partial [Methylococcaceae bacterium HT4]
SLKLRFQDFQRLMINLRIENAEMEQKLAEVAKSQKKNIEDVAIKAINNFLNSIQKKKIIYNKKNVTEHMHVIHKEYDVDDVALQHIKNSKEYIHLQRKKINR